MPENLPLQNDEGEHRRHPDSPARPDYIQPNPKVLQSCSLTSTVLYAIIISGGVKMVIIIVALVLFFWFAIALACVIVHKTNQAKKQARRILDGEVVSPARLKDIKYLLSSARNDIEAATLWRKLDDLNQKSP